MKPRIREDLAGEGLQRGHSERRGTSLRRRLHSLGQALQLGFTAFGGLQNVIHRAIHKYVQETRSTLDMGYPVFV